MKNVTSKEGILPIIILVSGLLNLTNVYDLSNIPALLITILGFVGVGMFIAQKGNFALIFKIWVLLQLPLIYTEIVDTSMGVRQIFEVPIFKTAQFFELSFGFTLTLKGGAILHIKLNLIPFFFFGLYKITATSGLIGKTLQVGKINNKSRYTNSFPVTGTVIKRVAIGKEKDWLLIDLEPAIEIGETQIKRALIHPKNKESFNKKKFTASYLRVVSGNEEVPETNLNFDNFPAYDWVKVKMNKK